MQSLRKPLLIAAAAGALIGGAAWAGSAHTHHLRVVLPDGQIAQVDYAGDVAPRVIVQPAAPVAAGGDPFRAAGFPGFGQIDRILADMQRQQAAMMQQAAAMAQGLAAHSPAPIAAGAAPANGNLQWSYVSATSTGDGCTQTVEYSSAGAAARDGQPRVIRTSTGHCDNARAAAPIDEAADIAPPLADTERPAGKAI